MTVLVHQRQPLLLRLVLGIAALAAVIALIVLLSRCSSHSEQTAKSGKAEFTLTIKRDAHAREAKWPEEHCMAFDTLQFRIKSQRPVYYAIFFKNHDTQELQKIVPPEDIMELAGSPGGDEVFPAIVLDKDWVEKTVYCLTSPDQIDAQDAYEAVFTGVDENLSNMHIQELVLRKIQ